MLLDDLTEMKLNDISALLDDEPEGNCRIEFMVRDVEQNFEVKLPSKSKKISVQKQFLDRVNVMEGIAYKLGDK